MQQNDRPLARSGSRWAAKARAIGVASRLTSSLAFALAAAPLLPRFCPQHQPHLHATKLIPAVATQCPDPRQLDRRHRLVRSSGRLSRGGRGAGGDRRQRGDRRGLGFRLRQHAGREQQHTSGPEQRVLVKTRV